MYNLEAEGGSGVVFSLEKQLLSLSLHYEEQHLHLLLIIYFPSSFLFFF